jgi:hypothetical protein
LAKVYESSGPIVDNSKNPQTNYRTAVPLSELDGRFLAGGIDARSGLEQYAIKFFWVSTINRNIPDDQTVTFSFDGKYSVSTSFKVYSPPFDTVVAQAPGDPLLGTKTGENGVPYNALGMLPRLIVGADGNAYSSGVLWSAKVNQPLGIGFLPGQFQFVQKVTPYRYYQDMDGYKYVFAFQGHTVLDTQDPYNSPSDFWTTGSGWQVAGDSPASSMDHTVVQLKRLNDAFNTYLMYRPPGFNRSEYEWVPLGMEAWSYGITVYQSPAGNGIWRTEGTPWTSIPDKFARETREPEWDNVLDTQRVAQTWWKAGRWK